MSDSKSAKHAPARFSTYFNAHENNLQQLRSAGFIDRDTLVLEAYAVDPPTWIMLGEISCKGRIILSVTKQLDCIDNCNPGDPLIQTVTYSYHASIRGGHNIMRYDNQHLHPNHPDKHHKHVFDEKTGEQLVDSPFWIGVKNWPTLGEVLWDLQGWHADHYSSLDEPDSFASPQNISNRLSQGFLP